MKGNFLNHTTITRRLCVLCVIIAFLLVARGLQVAVSPNLLMTSNI